MSEETSDKPGPPIPKCNRSARVEGEYGVDQMKYLTDLEHVRERSGMYIGDTGLRGLHHMVYEAVDNSIDEAMAGHAHEVSVTINVDGSVTVADDGRGIPVEIHPDLGISTLRRRDDQCSSSAASSTSRPTKPRAACTASASRWSISSPNGARSKSAATATSISRNTNAACRLAEVRRVGKIRPHRHQNHLQARPANLRQHQVRLQHAPPPLAGAGLPEPRREDRLSATSAPARAKRSNTSAASSQFIEHLNRASEAAAPRHHLHGPRAGRRRRRSRPAIHRRIHRERTLATSTTSTRSTAARTCPASAPP